LERFQDTAHFVLTLVVQITVVIRMLDQDFVESRSTHPAIHHASGHFMVLFWLKRWEFVTAHAPLAGTMKIGSVIPSLPTQNGQVAT
jgi:hypothetical protein